MRLEKFKVFGMAMALAGIILFTCGCGSKETTEEKAEKLMEEGKYEEAIELIVNEEGQEELLKRAKMERKYQNYIKEEEKEAALKDVTEYYNEEGYTECSFLSDRDEVENRLKKYYGTWYPEGKDTEVLFDEFQFMGRDYGVRYVISEYVNLMDCEAERGTIQLYYLDDEDHPFYMDVISSYVITSPEEGFGYNILYETSLNRKTKAYYTCSNTEYEEAVIAEILYYSEDSIIEKTRDAAEEQIYAELSKSNKDGWIFHKVNVLDSYLEYDSEDKKIVCNLTMTYNGNIFDILGTSTYKYYVTAEFKIKNGDVVLISLEVD
ncbi:MAG: hypothetical protein ACI4FZ_02935 [Lachnospiraceae bacterium]